MRQTKCQDAKLRKLDQAIAIGIADAEAGRLRPADEVFARLEAKYRAMGNEVAED
jgi:antitoxin ParD1/3/4